MKVYVVFSKLDENYGPPFKLFVDQGELERWMETHKDNWGLNYCFEEFDVELS